MQAYFNLDNGTGRILGIWGQGNTAAMKSFERWGQSLKDIGWKNVSPRSVTQTDHGSFENAGLPGFQFVQERLEYNSRTHHSNMDTFDHVQKDDVIQQGAVAAVFAWYAANIAGETAAKGHANNKPCSDDSGDQCAEIDHAFPRQLIFSLRINPLKHSDLARLGAGYSSCDLGDTVVLAALSPLRLPCKPTAGT